MKELKTQHRAVARYLAFGVSLREICEQFNLNHSTWVQVVSTPLFKHEQQRIESELEDRLIDDEVKDPVLAKLKMATVKAVTRLVEEIDNCQEGASASTRIKAAESILDRCGYSHKEKETTMNTVFVPIQQEKIDAIFKKMAITPQADSIQG
jgi:hypothetical protein